MNKSWKLTTFSKLLIILLGLLVAKYLISSLLVTSIDVLPNPKDFSGVVYFMNLNPWSTAFSFMILLNLLHVFISGGISKKIVSVVMIAGMLFLVSSHEFATWVDQHAFIYFLALGSISTFLENIGPEVVEEITQSMPLTFGELMLNYGWIATINGEEYRHKNGYTLTRIEDEWQLNDRMGVRSHAMHPLEEKDLRGFEKIMQGWFEKNEIEFLDC